MEKYGLLVVKSNEQINKEQAEQDAMNRVPDAVESQLASHIQRAWEINRWAKEEIEDEMLECLRQRNGEYDNKTLQAIREQGGSEIYMMLTATKIRAAVSWIRDILIPAGDKPWGLSPTPIPELPDFAMRAIAERIRETLPQGEPEEGYRAYIEQRASFLRDEVIKAMKLSAEDAAQRMETQIEDQLAEGGWTDALGEYIEDFATFPAAIMKAPLVRRKKNLSWGPQGQPVISNDIFLEYKRISPFDLYPSPDSSSINDGDLIERIRFNRRDLYNLIGLPGYNDEAIRAVLQEYGQGGLRDWLWRDYERAQLENKDRFWMRQDQKTIDGLHYWGSAQGLALLEWGHDPDEIDDPLAEYEIDAIKIGRHVIRSVINKDPLQRRPYHKASFQNVPGGFWGIAIPKLMRDQQRMCNATARSLANNLGISSGPMVEVEVDRLADGEKVEQLYPWKIIQTKSDKTGRGREAVRFFQPRSNSAELLRVYEEFERRADDATSIPRYAYGNERSGGAAQTSSGLAMLMNNASKGIKLAISSIDTYVIKQVIEHTFTFNMLYNPDVTIKGDVNVVARGATALLTKEQAQMRRAEFLAMTANPIDMEIIGPEGRVEVLRATAEMLDLNTDKIVPEQEEFISRQRERQEQQGQQPPDPKIIEIQQKGELEKEKMDMQSQQYAAKLDMDSQMQMEKLDAEIQKHREKLDMEYELKIRMMEEEARQKELDRDLEREKEAMAKDADVQRIKEEVRLGQEAKTIKEESEPKEPSGPATVVNLAIDNKSGEVKKTIDIKRGADKMISSAEVTEVPIEGEKQ
jgi:hypothetical protein